MSRQQLVDRRLCLSLPSAPRPAALHRQTLGVRAAKSPLGATKGNRGEQLRLGKTGASGRAGGHRWLCQHPTPVCHHCCRRPEYQGPGSWPHPTTWVLGIFAAELLPNSPNRSVTIGGRGTPNQDAGLLFNALSSTSGGP